jgi:hypothetical protein
MVIDLFLAELWLPRDWHRARTNLSFKNIAITTHGVTDVAVDQ